MHRLLCVLVLVTVSLAAPTPALAQRVEGPDAWAHLRFLFGTWEGAGQGTPGEGVGSFTFELVLDAGALLRRSHSSYPAAKDRPAVTHDDLMVIYREGGNLRALYVDNEGHVIHYAVATTDAPRKVTFTSAAGPDAPRYRFTYRLVGEDTVRTRFEIAPPGHPDAFALYVEGDARRSR